MPAVTPGNLIVVLADIGGADYPNALQETLTDGTLVQVISNLAAARTSARIGFDASLNLYVVTTDFVTDPLIPVRVNKFTSDGTYLESFSATGGVSIQALAVDPTGIMYLAYANPSDAAVFKHAADGSLIGTVDDTLSGPPTIIVSDLDLSSDLCSLIITTNYTQQIAQADGCLLTPLADFTTRPALTNDNLGVCWLHDGGIALATQDSGVIRYAADGSVVWTNDTHNRAWGAIAEDPSGDYIWASSLQFFGTPSTAVNRVTRFAFSDGASSFEFQPDNAADLSDIYISELAFVPSAAAARRFIYGTIVG